MSKEQEEKQLFDFGTKNKMHRKETWLTLVLVLELNLSDVRNKEWKWKLIHPSSCKIYRC